MSTNIFYNGVDYFTQNDLATPKVSRSSSPKKIGKYRGVTEIISLTGKINIQNIPGDCDFLSELKNKRDGLVTFFSTNYKTFKIVEDSVTILERDFCEILNISFDESNYVKILPYKIDIACVDESLNRELFNVKNAVNSTVIDKKKNGDYLMSRTISASGINNQDGQISSINSNSITNAFDNAINFVNSKQFIEENVFESILPSGYKIHLISQEESINRIKGFYGITKNYICTEESSVNDGVLNLKMEESKNFGSFSSYNVSGDIYVGKDVDFNNARSRFKSINFKSRIEAFFGVSDVFEIPDSVSITENQKGHSIFFNLSFSNNDNINSCGINEDIKYSIVDDENLITVVASGKISAKGHGSGRYDLVKDYFLNRQYNNTYESWIHEKCQTELNKVTTGVSLIGEPEEYNFSLDEKNGEINFSYQFSNQVKASNFKNYNCNVNMQVGVPRYKIDMNFGGSKDKYIISRTGFNVDVVSITTSGEYLNLTDNRNDDRNTALSELQSKCNTKFNEIQNLYLSSGTTTKSYMVINKRKNYNKNENIAQYFEERQYYDEIIR